MPPSIPTNLPGLSPCLGRCNSHRSNKGTFTWTTLIRQMCPLPPPFHQTSYSRFEEKSEQKMAEVRPILGILHLVGSPQSHLLSLLCSICERFPTPDVNSDPYGIMESVKVDCPSHETHQVSALGFVLLEMVEGMQARLALVSRTLHGPQRPQGLRDAVDDAQQRRVGRAVVVAQRGLSGYPDKQSIPE